MKVTKVIDCFDYKKKFVQGEKKKFERKKEGHRKRAAKFCFKMASLKKNLACWISFFGNSMN
jgi:hypothetical protein